MTTTRTDETRTATRAPTRATADFWFDPVCPWAWVTSRWMLEVGQVRPVDVRWHVMSLARLNADAEVSDEYRRLLDVSRALTRVCVAVGDKCGQTTLADTYTALGTRLHDRGSRPRSAEAVAEVLGEALAEAGAPVELAAAATNESWDETVAASHDAAITLVGPDVGTPVVSVDGEAFFGPVVTPVPRGEAAGRLWDGVRLVTGTDGFFEIKRSRTRKPSVA